MTDNPASPDVSALRNLSDTVHQRSRLSVLATLHEVGKAEFSLISQVTGLSDGNLSRHIKVLEDAGFVKMQKGYIGRRPRTWIEMTREGHRAFEEELQLLRNLVDSAERKIQSPDQAIPKTRIGGEPGQGATRPATS